MSDLNLAQAEAEGLIALEKQRVWEGYYDYPGLGGLVDIPLLSVDGREKFRLTIRRGRIDLAQATYQNLARGVVPLLRLDLNGPPHKNPDGTRLECPHLHIYREHYGDKWAQPLPPDFSAPGDLWTTLDEFQTFCNIRLKPFIRQSLGAHVERYRDAAG